MDALLCVRTKSSWCSISSELRFAARAETRGRLADELLGISSPVLQEWRIFSKYIIEEFDAIDWLEG
ncbi:hypothetical protein K0M31_002086 [Melipona bicolor]|uniref:Uncharacterized protein n=1 Tax=Melipona bicolor TaxID=60889 RepID=A0AA40KYU9_9HYME|nr:hypothetical protein K0M31_002086 [Melipona bicolor]